MTVAQVASIGVAGLSMILAGIWVIRGESDTPPDPPAHDGRAILGNPALLDYLTRYQHPAPTDPVEIAKILRGRVIELPGGLLVSRCRPCSRHHETMGCWAYYAAPQEAIG